MVSVILKTDILFQDNTLPVMIPIVATQVPAKIHTQITNWWGIVVGIMLKNNASDYIKFSKVLRRFEILMAILVC